MFVLKSLTHFCVNIYRDIHSPQNVRDWLPEGDIESTPTVRVMQTARIDR
jgi:hypothetical protein